MDEDVDEDVDVDEGETRLREASSINKLSMKHRMLI